MNTRRTLLRSMAVLALALGAALPARAEDYPTRPIRLIVPFAPGGNTDVAGRFLAKGMGDILGQPIVVENKGGAGATIGAGLAANSPADGYTLLVTSSALTISPSIYKKVPYDMTKDFEPIGRAMVTSLALVSSLKLGVKNVDELLARAKANPGKLTYSSAGVGSGSHLAGVLFNQATHIEAMHIPYKGSGPATSAILSGEVDYTFTSQAAALPLVNSGKVTALAVTSKAPSPLFAGIPTVDAVAAKGFEAGDWIGLTAAAGTPKPIIDRLNKALVQWLADPKAQAQLMQAGFEAKPSSPEAFSSLIQSELKKWSETAKLAGIEKQ